MSAAAQQDMPLPPRATPRDSAGTVEHLNLSLIRVNPQVRRKFDEDKLRALADSIHEAGVIQPIVVRWVDALCAYELLAGERRYRAATMVGLATIPAVVRNDLSDDDALALQMIENLQRESLTTDEMVNGVGHMVDRCGTLETARKLSMHPSVVSRIAGTRTLWQPARKLIEDGKLDSVDLAHELAKLASLNEDAARGLVQAWYTPRAHNPAPPTRAEIRSRIDIERKAIDARAEETQVKTQTEIALDNQRGYSSTAGDERPAPKPKAPASDDTPPPESKAGKEMAQRIEADNSERIALVKATRSVADRIELAARQLLGIESRPNPNDSLGLDRPLYSLFGRDMNEHLSNGDPVLVSVDNVQLTRLPRDAGSIDEARYTLTIELPDASEKDLLGLLASLAIQSGEEAQPTDSPAARQLRLVQQFLDETCEKVDGAAIKASWLHGRFVEWFGTEALTIQHFGNAMKLIGYSTHRHKTGFRYLDLQPREGDK